MFTTRALAVYCLLSIRVYGLILRREEPAPYYRADDEALLINDEYGIVLHESYTLDDHFKFIGVNLEQGQNETMFQRISLINGYRARLDFDLVHDKIRYDPGVEFVEHDIIAQWEPPVSVTENATSPLVENDKLSKRYFMDHYRSCPWYDSMIQVPYKQNIPDIGPCVGAFFCK